MRKERRRLRKKKLVELFGGKCVQCGYHKNNTALEFHHTKNKLFGLSAPNITRYSWETILKEAEKCILLCSNCHKELHSKINESEVNDF